MSNRTYDRLKFVAQILLPATGTLYFSLAGIWGFPSAEEVVATIVAVDTFLGVFLQLKSERYKRKRVGTGKMNVRDHGDKTMYDLELDGDPGELAGKDKVVFDVAQPSRTGRRIK